MYTPKYFTNNELACHCGCDLGIKDMNENLLILIDKLREKVGVLIVNSGIRCEKHNREIGGRPSSFHLRGEAVDFKVESYQHADKIIQNAYELEFGGKGISINLSKINWFVHLDIGSKRMWSY